MNNRLSGVDVSTAGMKVRGRIKLKGLETGRRIAPCYVPFEVHLENLLESSWEWKATVKEGKGR